MSNEELSALQEELDAARAEVERLQESLADREARAAHVESQLAEARAELAQVRSESEAREAELAGLREREQSLAAQVQEAAQRYRALALQQAPELPEELVTGDSVDAIDEALQQARETVSKVRGHLESQAQAGRVPVGAPARSGPDPSSLSSDDKMRLGLQQRS
jgi:septation ring formation regulator EzrA